MFRRLRLTCMKSALVICQIYRSKMTVACPPQIVRSNMSAGMTFVQKFSPVTGKMEWIQQADDYDYHQEVARSAYADMLHDTERNQKYYDALRDAIKLMHQKGKPALVLDIGTGTGLLSMMAVSCGADMVTACEAFKPMAGCARQGIFDNAMDDKITLVPKRSTELTVGEGCDLSERANILVTEVFDTELIGEGGIPTFHHAHENLLTDDCIVVPSAANMYAQVVHSDFARGWNKFQSILDENGDEVIRPCPEMADCPGMSAVHDIQLDQVSPDQFTPIMEPVKVFRFDYSGKSPILFSGKSVTAIKALNTGSCDAVFMWWDLEMDTRGKILLSCAPRWAHPTPNEMPWRDHWMQAVYFPQSSLEATSGEEFTLHSSHDDYSLWFDVSKSDVEPKPPPVCHCGAHMACSRTRVGMLNDPVRNLKYQKVLKDKINESSVCLCIGDTSLLPLLAAKAGAKHVYAVEINELGRTLLNKYIEANNVKNVTVLDKRPEDVKDKDFNSIRPNLILGEPHFTTSILPWHNVYFWYARTEMDNLFSSNPSVLPYVASIKAIAVEFKDLWKIRAPVGICEGFDISAFDEMIEDASDMADENVEAQPLWEYPGKPLSEEFDMINFDFSHPLMGIKTVKREGCIEFTSEGTCNGLALWMEYRLDKNTVVSTGLTSPPVYGENLKWDCHTRQAVHLFKHPRKVGIEKKSLKLQHRLLFTPKTGEFEFAFKFITL